MKEYELFPKRIMLEVTNHCNHNCVFCANSKMKRKKRVIDIDLAKKIIVEARENGAEELSFHGMGEPLICKELVEYVKLAKQVGYEYLYIDTNGALATPEVINPLIDAGLDSVKFSISGASRSIYEKVNGKDDFDIVMRNLENLSKYKAENGLKFKLWAYFAENTYNKEEAAIFQRRLEKIVDKVIISPINSQGGEMYEENKSIQINNTFPLQPFPCREVFDRMVILCDGRITACCMDFEGQMVYGDSNSDSLLEAWNTEVIRAIRRQHLGVEKLNKLCALCTGNFE